MDHISKHLQLSQPANPPGPINSLACYNPTSTLSPEERKVVELKYQAPQIGKLSPLELGATVKGLLIRIHVITGWTIPAGDLLNVLLDQFEKKLLEDYPDLNADEIEYAFRSKGTVVEDWGKAMNLNLVDKVLIPYKNERFLISQQEERVVPPPVLPAPETTDEEFIQAVLTVYRLNRDYKSIPVLAYKTLEPKMGLTRADKQRIYQKVHETTKEGDLRELCRQYAVKEYFDKLIQDENRK